MSEMLDSLNEQIAMMSGMLGGIAGNFPFQLQVLVL